MTFALPSGFLGRQLAQQASQDLRFPSSLKDWGDEHRVAYLFTRGVNLLGNALQPLMSGYRNDRGKVTFTTFYDTQIAQAPNEANKGEFRLVLPVDKILSMSRPTHASTP